jgi:replicative DNA helicase
MTLAQPLPRPPRNEEVEQNFLADALSFACVDPEKIDLGDLGETVRPEHFYDPRHGRIWNAALHCASNNVPIDLFTLLRLVQTGDAKADQAFKELLIHMIGDGKTQAPGNPKKGARLVQDFAQRRDLYDACVEGLTDAATDDHSRSAADRLEALEARLFELAERGAGRRDSYSMADVRAATDALIEQARKAPNGIVGCPTGLLDLDRRLRGLKPGALYVLAGRPGMGKTAMGLTIAVNAARAGKRVLFISLEMPKEELFMRCYAMRTGISMEEQVSADLSPEQLRQMDSAGEVLGSLPIEIDEGSGLTMAQIRSQARRARRRGGLDLLVIDYLQLVRPSDPKIPKVYQIEEVTVGLKRLSKELGIPVLLLSQLNREVERRDDKRPMMSDLRDSGSIEQDADVVMLLYREEYYLKQEAPTDRDEEEEWMQRLEAVQGLAEVITAKFRQGRTGTDRVLFEAERQRFSNLEQRGRR